ncbi:family 20 glycosylhydrolase [Rapidithrix thailandica]|uniref:beta-N-acetylhexosaminidase n=2 Tax=Rapidithrix thailandica TaxID=413964 RepID=A0AAW9S0K8_9BACT
MSKEISKLTFIQLPFLAVCILWISSLSEVSGTVLTARNYRQAEIGRLALLPYPKEVQHHSGTLLLSQDIKIICRDTSLEEFVPELKNSFRSFPTQGEIRLELSLETVEVPMLKEEAYVLDITPQKIGIKANRVMGIRWGIRTLQQLLELTETPFLQAMTIKDWPSFKVRGLMHDVGRNFIPLNVLKEHIRIMSAYKLNTFHWHLTEDIAWRLESKKYPELNQPENMLRDPGMYYTFAEARELIAYAEMLGVNVIPEIDMPGHSQAFERAFSTDMQSEKGSVLVKELLLEVCEELDVSTIHIGGDEVKIYNKDFLPEMIRLLEEQGKQVIGWLPGGNLKNTVIRQLWTGMTQPPENIPAIDSRHLYLNHNDPLSGVVKIFNRQICDVSQGDPYRLGAIACIWPDRRSLSQKQLIQSNALFPSLLALAERIWQGGGYPEYSVNMGPEESEQFQAFRAFENRLLLHKKKFFQAMPFPYVRQTQVSWALIGPFANHGNLKQAFAPEDFTKKSYSQSAMNVRGSTVWLRHCFHPYAFGHLKDASPKSTYYALTKVNVSKAREGHLWVSFHNPSRSEKDATPSEGKWDYKESKIWLNGQELAPPKWSKPGREGHAEAPLLDESYEMRPPLAVELKEGWNTILVKLPVGAFTTKHTRLVKWMFTAALVERVDGQWEALEGVEYKAL